MVIILPMQKRENDQGIRKYARSRAIEYGAVRLMDIFKTPAFIFTSEDEDGILKMEKKMGLPQINSIPMIQLKH
jgi:hypothetical protein